MESAHTARSRSSPGTVIRRLTARSLARLTGQWPRLAILALLAIAAMVLIQHGPVALAIRAAPANDQAEPFMRALRDHDGQALWNAMSEDMRNGLVGRSGAPPTQQGEQALARLLAERSTLTGYQEVAHHNLKQGGVVHFFVATTRDQSNNEVEVPFMITVDGEGRVAKVE